MNKNDLLDDEFSPYLEALSEEQLKSLKGKIPYSILRGNVLTEVCELLMEHHIEYTLQPQEATTNGTGIIPLSSTQLNMVDTLVYIDPSNKSQADQLIEAYEAQLQAQTAQNPATPPNSKQFYFWSAVFLIIIAVLTYYLQWKNINYRGHNDRENPPLEYLYKKWL